MPAVFLPSVCGERIPPWHEVFASVGSRADQREIANYASVGDALPDKIAALVIQHGLQERVMFSSFHPLNLLRIRGGCPGTPVAILSLRARAGLAAARLVGRLFSPDYPSLPYRCN
jgi:hypothetical protein